MLLANTDRINAIFVPFFWDEVSFSFFFFEESDGVFSKAVTFDTLYQSDYILVVTKKGDIRNSQPNEVRKIAISCSFRQITLAK